MGGWVKDERNSVEKTLMLAATMSPNITVYGYKQTSINIYKYTGECLPQGYLGTENWAARDRTTKLEINRN